MNTTYYFSHDGNARNDSKILELRAEHGWLGYGVYWGLIEMMFEHSDTKLKHKDIKIIAMFNNVDITVLSDVINTCITAQLFESDGEFFWSHGLLNRKGVFMDSIKQKSEAGKAGMAKRWGNRPNNTLDNAVITPIQHRNNDVITADNKERKVNKVNKEKKDIQKEKVEPLKTAYGIFNNVLLTDDEYDKLKNKYGIKRMESEIENLSTYMKSHNKEYASHYATILCWDRKNGKDEQADKPKDDRPFI